MSAEQIRIFTVGGSIDKICSDAPFKELLWRSLLAVCICASGASAIAQPGPAPLLRDLFQTLDRSASWQLLNAVELQFDTHHPQGLTRVGDDFFLSAVEIVEPTRRLANADAGPDRSAGRGVGHLFKFSTDGNLLAAIQLGDGARYHPGGIDYDGQWLWISVAEYRPDSHSLVYRVDPDTLATELVFEFPDHLGAIIHDRDAEQLVAASWGSRRFYRWRSNMQSWSDPHMQRNAAHYVDLQDCQSLPASQMLCAGLAGIRGRNGEVTVIGGLELIDLNTLTAIHQLPVVETASSGALLTRNPIYLSPAGTDLLLFAAPEDNQSRLYTYRLSPGD